MPRSPYLTRIKVMGASGNNPTNGRFSHLLQIFERSSDRRAYDHSTCFVLWIERDDITRNRQVSKWIHLWPDHLIWSANQNNNLFNTMIIEDPTIDDCRSMEDICITMIIRFHRLILVFKDLSDFKHHIFRQSDTKKYHLARNAKCRFCDFFGSQRTVENHEMQAHRNQVDGHDQYELSNEETRLRISNQPAIRNASTGRRVRWLRVSH